MANNTTPLPHQRITNPQLLFLLIGSLVMICIGIGQDLLSSIIRDHSFYLSESSLYKTGWLLYLPLIPVAFYVSTKINRLPNISSWLVNGVFFGFMSLFHIAITAGVIYGLSALFFSHAYRPIQVFQYFLAEEYYLIWLLYMMIPFSQKIWPKTNTTENNSDLSEKYSEVLPITANGKTELVPVNQILYFTSDRPYIAVITKTKKYLYPSSLKSILSKIDGEIFSRVHRSTIVNTNYISSLHSRANGDYDIEMKNGMKLRMSRNYSQTVKAKLNLSSN